jgi:hypothetical protein
MNAFFWWLLNIGVPIAGPILMLGLFSVTHGKAVARQLIVESIKGGQLLWSAIAISAAALYEGATALEREPGPAPLLELAVTTFLLIAFACSMLVMLITIKHHDDRLRAPSAYLNLSGKGARAAGLAPRSPFPETAAVTASIWLTGAAALLFGALHMVVS